MTKTAVSCYVAPPEAEDDEEFMAMTIERGLNGEIAELLDELIVAPKSLKVARDLSALVRILAAILPGLQDVSERADHAFCQKMYKKK